MFASFECQSRKSWMTESADALSEVFRGVAARGWIAPESSFIAPWCFRGSGNSATFYCIVQGQCWLELDGVEVVQRLGQGDLAVIMPGREHSLRDSQGRSTVPRQELVDLRQSPPRRPVAVDRGGDSTALLYGGLLFDTHRREPLLSPLPSFSIVRGIEGKAVPWLEQILRLILQEGDLAQPGAQSVVDHLIQAIFIQAIRASLVSPRDKSGSGLTAVTDPDIASALKLMQAAPYAPWTVASLADRVGLSRSVFAARFKAQVSQSPMHYLFELRMGLACGLIADGRSGVKQIAAQLGYASRDAFSSAFKRWKGLSPGAYRRLFANCTGAEDDSPP
jgi:AraC-like DNA-binding protein